MKLYDLRTVDTPAINMYLNIEFTSMTLIFLSLALSFLFKFELIVSMVSLTM